MLPFDKTIFRSSLKHATLIGLLGFLLIYLIWGEIIVDDLIGMSITIPLLAYMIHMVRLFK
ncbi:MAG: hypothetical protein AAF847_10170 [Bacteroidota bacterium]